MAIQSVRANVNGTWHTLTFNSDTGKWTATITAPGATSFHQPGGYYNVQIEAKNAAGTTTTEDASTLDGLKLYVKETVAPVITIVSPTDGAYVSNSRQPVVLNATDEQGGSGVNLSSLVIKMDGTPVTGGITSTTITNGYSITYTPETALEDGQHTFEATIKDNDGNISTAKSTTYTIDTVPPILNVTSPTDHLITAAASLTVSGTTNDATSSPVTVTIELNGTDQGAVTVSSSGVFSKTVTLQEGDNIILITATDAANKVTSVARTVTLDSSTPEITSVSMTPNPVDAGMTMLVEVVVV